MSELQESVTHGDELTSAAAHPLCEGFRPAPGEIIWRRTDWKTPVGFFDTMQMKRMRSQVRGMYFTWARVDFPRIRLAHKAALMLLQGQALSAILIPNHLLENPLNEFTYTAGHVLLRCDPWQYHLAVPELTGVTIAKLGEIPDGIGAAETLAALAQDSAA